MNIQETLEKKEEELKQLLQERQKAAQYVSELEIQIFKKQGAIDALRELNTDQVC